MHYGFRFYDDGFNSYLFGFLSSFVNSLYLFEEADHDAQPRQFHEGTEIKYFSSLLLLLIAFP